MTEKEKHINNYISRLSVPSYLSKEEVWKNIEPKIQSDIKKPVRVIEIAKNLNSYIAIAASFVLIITIYLVWLPGKSKTILSQSKEPYTLILPDSSEVILNAETSVKYNPAKWKRKRIVEMRGEAFFRVKKGKSFIVKTKMGIVKVMGTSFNVLSNNNNFEVACFTGKVQVKSSGRKSIAILTPGLFTKYKNSGKLSSPASFNPNDIASWRNSEFYFTNSPLEKVLSVFENQYQIEVHRPDLTNRNYTGYFPKNDMEKALRLICIPMNLEYKILNSKEIRVLDK